MSDQVDILLATYNGEEFIAEQLDSILSQTHQQFQIIIGDDASRDSTPEIVHDYAHKKTNKIFFNQYLENAGCILNFSRIADFSDADYIMLSDQDDIWHPQKIEKTLAKMKQMEEAYGKETPLLVHTDAQLIDERKGLITPSFWKYCDIFPNSNSLARVLAQNNAIGCTIMINRALLNLAFPIPVEAAMHDHWINLVATVFGKVGWISEPTVSYRQHGNNWMGVHKRVRFKEFCTLFGDEKKVQVATRLLYAKIIQAFVFYKRYESLLDEATIKTLKRFINLKNDSFLEELKTRLYYDFLPDGFWRATYHLAASYLHGPIPDKYKIKV